MTSFFTALSGFDYLLLALLILSVSVGVLRGAVREMLSLGAWVLALWASLSFGSIASQKLAFIEMPQLRFLLSNVLIFIITRVVAQIFVRMLDSLVRRTFLSSLNHTFGLLFGIGRALFVYVIIVILVVQFQWSGSDWWLQSYSGPVLEGFYRLYIADSLPQFLPFISG